MWLILPNSRLDWLFILIVYLEVIIITTAHFHYLLLRNKLTIMYYSNSQSDPVWIRLLICAPFPVCKSHPETFLAVEFSYSWTGLCLPWVLMLRLGSRHSLLLIKWWGENQKQYPIRWILKSKVVYFTSSY